MCEKFTQLGIPIDYSDMEKNMPMPSLRGRILRITCLKGYIKAATKPLTVISVQTVRAMCRVKNALRRSYPPDKNAGGVPILAHPVLYHLGKEPMNKHGLPLRFGHCRTGSHLFHLYCR